jgi:hypothetical protein
MNVSSGKEIKLKREEVPVVKPSGFDSVSQFVCFSRLHLTFSFRSGFLASPMVDQCHLMTI